MVLIFFLGKGKTISFSRTNACHKISPVVHINGIIYSAVSDRCYLFKWDKKSWYSSNYVESRLLFDLLFSDSGSLRIAADPCIRGKLKT